MAHLTDLGIRQVDDPIVQISKEVYHIVLLQNEFLKTMKRSHLLCRLAPP
jgi:hypothetical protein